MSSSQSYGVHFFKIILEITLRDGELKVPTSFMKRYWEGMSNPVTLRLPNKTEWKVGWKKKDGDIWLFNNGWKEFAEYVCLSKLQFVVFQYEGNSCFNVIVLAKNGLEIKYKETRDSNSTTRTAAEEEEEEEDKVEESDCSVKVLDDPPSLPSKRPKSAPQSSQPHKKRKTNPKDQKENKQQSSQQQHHKKKKMKVEAHSGFDNATKQKNSGSSSKYLKKRMEDFHEIIKNDFHSKKDYFICTIQESFIKKDRLIIPNEFSRSHLLNMNGRSTTLFVVDHKNRTWEWDVKLKLYNNNQINFVAGWKKFSMDNNLKVGDVCAFVLNKSKWLSFQVHPFPFEKEIRTPPL